MKWTLCGATRRYAKAGTVALEFAIALPVLLLFLLGLIDAGRLFWAYNTLESAVQSGGLCASSKICLTNASVLAKVQSALAPLDPASITLDVRTNPCGAHVHAAYEFAFLLPGVNSTAIDAVTCMPLP